MPKNPAVNFYTSDFLTGTAFMSNCQVGAYIRLLSYQHQYGHLSKKQMHSITKDPVVLSKFLQDENGFFYNKRMDFEIEKKSKYSESRSKNRLKCKTKSTSYENHMKNISSSYDKHMENINENINGNINNSNLYKYIESNFGRTLSPIEIEEISKWEDNELTRHAIQESLLNQVRSIKYIKRILQNYASLGIKNLSQVIEYEEKFRKKIKEKDIKVMKTPKWLDENPKGESATKEEQEEMEKFLNQFQ